MLTVLIFSSFLPARVLSIDNNDNAIKVILNGKTIKSDVEPRIINGRTVVPLRAIFEALGAQVEWNDKIKTVIARKNSDVIAIKVGSTTAFLNSKAIELDVPATISDGRTLVPIRFVSESFGYDVKWNDASRTVSIDYPSKTITPTLSTTPTLRPTITLGPTLTLKPTPTLTKTLTSSKPEDSFDGNIDGLIGLSSDAVMGIFGSPERVDLSKYGFEWYIYNKDYKKYIQIGVQDGVIVGVFTNSANYSAWQTVEVLTDKSSVDNLLGTPLTYIKKGNTRYIFSNSRDQEVFDVEGKYFATLYYDSQNGNKVSAIQLIDRAVELKLNEFYGKPSERLRQSYELEVFDLANSVRARLGKTLFKWDEKAAVAARKHSEDMAVKNYFDHTSPDGKSPFDRMEDEGIKFSRAAENIAMGQTNSIEAHETLMNSPGHRSNILGDCEKLGVGVYIGSGNKIYYTQNFYSGYK